MKKLIALLMVLTLMITACTTNTTESNPTSTTTDSAATTSADSTTTEPTTSTSAEMGATETELPNSYRLLDTGKRTESGDFIYELWNADRAADKITFWVPAEHRVMMVPHTEEGLLTFARSEEQKLLMAVMMQSEELGIAQDRLLYRDKNIVRPMYNGLLAEYDATVAAFRFLSGALTEEDAEAVATDKAPAEGYVWKLDAERFANLEAFESFLSEHFTANLVKAAMEDERVREFDGALYLKPGEMHAHDMFGGHYALEIKQISGSEYHYLLRSVDGDQLAVAEPFVLKREEDGAFRFQNFDSANEALHHGKMIPIK